MSRQYQTISFQNINMCFLVLFPSRVTVQTPQWTEKWLDELDEDQTMAGNEVRK